MSDEARFATGARLHEDHPDRRAEIIGTEHLSKVYPGGITAVDRLDLSVKSGEIFGLLGPNGAGKTTTVGMLTTRIVPTSGRAHVGGVDVVSEPAKAKQAMGVVPQTNTLDRSLTVFENLYFHGRYFGMRRREAKAGAADLLERFRLSERGRARVAELSGGMAQRLMLARAIMHRPRVLFLDEPTAGLDPQSRLALWDLLRQLHRDGQTVLLTTHYMEEADVLCDRVAIMDHGRLLALDTPSGLKRSTEAHTIVRLAAGTDLARLAEHMGSLATVVATTVTDGHVLVALTESHGVVPLVIGHAAKAGFDVTDLSVTEPTLETVFIRLTGRDLRE